MQSHAQKYEVTTKRTEMFHGDCLDFFFPVCMCINAHVSIIVAKKVTII
jgi:hypothetical protein